MATDVMFYIFKMDLICSNKVWWSIDRHFSHLTVDFNMEAGEEMDRLKKNYADKKCYLIKSDLGYWHS